MVLLQSLQRFYVQLFSIASTSTWQCDIITESYSSIILNTIELTSSPTVQRVKPIQNMSILNSWLVQQHVDIYLTFQTHLI